MAATPDGYPRAKRTSPEFGRRASWPVGRVLCTRSRGPAAIHLGLPLLTASCGLPASSGGAALKRSRSRRGRNHGSLLTLLRVGFTEPPQSPAALVVSYTTVSPLPPGQAGGGLFSVALSRGSPRVGVTDHPALRSPDLPRRAMKPRHCAAARPARPPLPRGYRHRAGCQRCAVSLSDRSNAGPSANQSISVSDATSR